MGFLIIIGVIWLIIGIFIFMSKSHEGNLGCGWLILAALLGPFTFFLASFVDSMPDDEDDLN